jgi:hypothetical protein
VVCTKVRGLREALSAATIVLEISSRNSRVAATTIALEISSRNSRVAALHKRWDACARAWI